MTTPLKLSGKMITVPITREPDTATQGLPEYESHIYVVMVLGYWGRGYTIKEAVHNCIAEGGKKSDLCLLRVIFSTTLPVGDLFNGTSVDGNGCINYPNGCFCIPTFNPQNAKVKLGSLFA